jgi:hypothetical protein
MCNQLTVGFLQLEHFIFHSGRTWPHSWQDQMIFVIFTPLTAIKLAEASLLSEKRGSSRLVYAAV